MTGRPASVPTADTPVHQESLRHHNLTLAFRHIVAAAPRPISRTELAARTGLTRPTVSRIVDELVAGRLVAEAGPDRRTGAGRPPVGLVLSRRGPAGLGLDIKGDYLAAGVVDLTGTVRHLAFAPGGQAGRSPQDVVADLARLSREAVAAAAAEELTVTGATLAVPGLVGDDGEVKLAPSLGWREVPVGPLLHRATGLAVSVDNEANLAALGELHAGDERLTSFIYVSGELGLGSGIVLGGRLLRGVRGWSGELGHVVVDQAGPACRCGSNGCLEVYAGLDTIRRSAPASGVPPASAIAAAADAGEPAVLAALHTAANALGVVLSGLVNVLDIDAVVLGGSYAVLSAWLTAEVQAQVDRRVLAAAWSPVGVQPAILGAEAAVIGAALTVVERVRANPPGWLGVTVGSSVSG